MGKRTSADVGIRQIEAGVLVESLLALITVGSIGVMHAVDAHASRPVSVGNVHVRVERALCGVLVAVALCKKGKEECSTVQYIVVNFFAEFIRSLPYFATADAAIRISLL